MIQGSYGIHHSDKRVLISQKIAKLAHENVVYMYLAGHEKPDFRTICNFKKEYKGPIEAAFKETVTLVDLPFSWIL